jgi:DNA mismatch repair protein MutS2
VFRFKGDKFPILKLLQGKEAALWNRGAKPFDKELVSIQHEIEQVEQQIQIGLVQRVFSVSRIIDEGLDLVSRLDVLFSKAAFGKRCNGVLPKVGSNGIIDVQNFVHPVLAIQKDWSVSNPGSVVPTDLHLSNVAGSRALIISGPNGGGKTLAMKSFGMCSVLLKLGIPIPVSTEEDETETPQVGYFSKIFVEVGDQQSVAGGESTWTAKLNACASIIEKVVVATQHGTTNNNYLVLMDELGGGTDPEAGGAVAQAILEQLMRVESCRIVATTHSPRLKTLSYDNPEFGCATVLLKRDSSSEYRLPTFQLVYGLIGDSYALGAASRCVPALPEEVLSRAAELVAGDATLSSSKGDYLRALTKSMELQTEMATAATIATDKSARDAAKCRAAMISLAAAYNDQLALLEQRVENCYQSLRKGDEKNEMKIVGETLSELRAVRKVVQNQKELLRKRGLKMLPDSYKLRVGESVVIITEDEWDGTTATVLASSFAGNDGDATTTLSPNHVLVQLSSSLFHDDPAAAAGAADSNNDDVIVVGGRPSIMKQRHELAIWDYDSVYEYERERWSTSVPDSKRKLSTLLTTLAASSSNVKKRPADLATERTTTTFTSARQRKAGATKKGKKK